MLKYIIFFIVIFIIGILIYRDYKDFYNSEKVNLRIKESFKIKENFKDTEKTKDENILLKAKNFLKDKIESVLNVSIEEKEDDFVDMIVDYYNNNSEGLENYKNKFNRFKSWLLIKNKNFLDKFEKLDLTEYIKDDEEIVEHFGETAVTAFTQMGIDKCSWVKRDIINQVKKLNKLIGETKNLSSEDKETQQSQLDEINGYCNKVGLETCQTSDETYEIGQLVETRSYNNEITQNYYTAYVVAANYETYCLDKEDGHPCLNDDNNLGYCEDGLCKLDITNNANSVGVEENNKNSDNNANILSYDLLVYGKLSREINVDPKYIRRGEDIENLESSIMLEKDEINDQKIAKKREEAYTNFNNIFSNLDVTSEKYDQTKYNYCLALKDYVQEASNKNTIIDTSKFEDDYVIEKLTYWKCDYVSQIAKAKDQFEEGTYDIYQYRYDKKSHNWIFFREWLQEKCLENINDIFKYLEIRIKDYVDKTAATFCTDRVSDMQNEVFGDSDSNNSTTTTPTITTTERQKDQFDDELEIYYNNFTLRDKLLEVLRNICGDPDKLGNNYEGDDEDFTLILNEIFDQFRTSLDDLDSEKLVKTSLIKVCNKTALSDKIDWIMYQVYKSYPNFLC